MSPRSATEEQPLSSSWSTSNGLNDFVETSHEEERYEENDSPFERNSPPLGSSLPKEILQPTFATGWATSQETKPFSQIAPGALDEKSDQSYLSAFWPVSDLGLKNLQVSNDDELGKLRGN